ncbi:hypothetical protein LIN78_06465 [Leeia sp. TBRC 13508]|uniref:Uncharacterized protein n=1 Tax=Leeia speluncae TaxID=2884804 RepID=A0ABS8D6C9_9NEIS|nr:hypothetical protein [Leeia speluncae]MCB6183183.1 hypothetical protein [Leeia speluncae]
MTKLVYILYAIAISCSLTLYNVKTNNDHSTYRSWGRSGSNSGMSSGDWYSGGHHK